MNDINIILGSPGCGKTTRLIDILKQELECYNPDKIAFVSFTRKSVQEGRDRAIEMFNYKKNDFPFFRTLHSIAFQQMGFSRHNMISKKDYKIFSKLMGMKFTGFYTEDLKHVDDKYLFLNFLERNNLEIFKLYIDTVDINIYKNIKHNYKRFKDHKNIIDFTDMIESFIEEDQSLPVDIAIIDEAQDLTNLQWKMCEVAFKNCKKVYVAGDDDQCIYAWNGADVDYFLKLNGKRTILKQSYRLQKKILEYAKGITAKIENRIDKDFHAIGDNGNIFFYNDVNEIEINEDESYYFLSRNNCFLEQHENYIKSKHFVYKRKDKLSFDRYEIRAINLFEKMRKTKKLNIEDEMMLNPYLKGIINLNEPWYYNLNFNNDTIGYYKDLVKFKVDLNKCNIEINTAHGTKGGEADNVVLSLDFTRAVSENFNLNPDSELRTLYVACTRSKKNLHLIFKQGKHGYSDFLNMKEMSSCNSLQYNEL